MFLNFLHALHIKNDDLLSSQIIFSLNATHEILEEMEAMGLTVYNIQGKENSNFSVLRQLLNCIATENIDVVYGQNFICNFLVALAGILRPKLNVITHEHGTIWKGQSLLARLVNQFWVTFSDTIICNSQATKIYITSRYKVKKDKMSVIYNGVPAATDMSNERIESQQPRLLFVGRLWSIKSVDSIIQAVNYVKRYHPTIALDILGDGPLRADLENMVKDLKLEDIVHFHGYVDNVSDFLADATLMLVPSIRESLGNVVIEAAFQSVPSIASQVDGLFEVIDDHKTGRLLIPTEPIAGEGMPKYVVDVESGQLRPPRKVKSEQLAEVILECLSNPEKTKNMGIKAREKVVEQFSMDRYVTQITEMIK